MPKKGYKQTEEHKQKISEGGKGKHIGQIPWNKNITLSEEHKRKISIGNTGKKRSEESRKKSSISHLGQKAWNKNLTKEIDERVKRISENNKGDKNPAKRPEVREKMSASKKGKNHPLYGTHRSDETKQRISIGNKGKPKSEEHKKNMSNSMKGRNVWITGLTKETDERVKRISESRRGEKCPMFGRTGEKHPMFGVIRSGKNNPNYGNHQSEETKQILREKALLRMQIRPGPFKDTKPELIMKKLLTERNILFEHQFKVENCSFDFHIVGTKILIEVDGDYFHGNPKKFFKLNKMQLRMKERDKKHDEVALSNGYILFRFWEDDILHNTEEVKNKIYNSFKSTNICI